MLRAASSNRDGQQRRGRILARVPVACIASVALIAVAGCGSSKPAYCSSRTNLENSIKGLTSLNLSSGVSGLEAQANRIESDANSLVSAAKSDFPSETSALKTSVDGLANSLKGLPSSPSAAQIAAVGASASSLVNSVKGFVDTTKSKCS